jgi:lactoylglutathione lyase
LTGNHADPVENSLVIPIQGLFETHLNVSNLERSLKFYTELLGLPPAGRFPDRRLAFVWVPRPHEGLLGLWEVGYAPQRLSLHVAFRVSLEDLLNAVEVLRSRGIEALDFYGKHADELVVRAWMPAAAIYFLDPDGNLIEFISMLPDPSCEDLGIVNWSDWLNRRAHSSSTETE